MFGKILVLPMIAVTLLFAGCASMPLPVGEKQVNTDLYKSPDEFAGRVKTLRTGMTRGDTFKILGVTEKTPNFKQLTALEIWQALNGGAQFMLPRDEVGTRVKMNDLEGWELPYSDVKKYGWLAAPFHVKYGETGHELAVVLVFSKGMLFDKRFVGVMVIDRTEKKILVNPFEDLNGLIRIH